MDENPALRLYTRSLAGQWNADRDLDWNQSTALGTPELDAARHRLVNDLYWSERQSLWTVKRMNIPIHRYFNDHHFSLVAAAHTFDESRHVYVLERYCQTVGGVQECPLLWRVITRIADFAGNSVVNYFYSILVSETLGEVLFAMLRHSRGDALLKSICERALRDEARHIAYVNEALRRIHPRLGTVGRLRTKWVLRSMIYFGLRGLRRNQADAATLGIGQEEYLDYFERKLIGSIRRAGIEAVLSPDEVHDLVAPFRTSAAELVDRSAVAELTALEDGTGEVPLLHFPSPPIVTQTAPAGRRPRAAIKPAPGRN